MRHLSSALYCEGTTDAHFLRPLLLRLCEGLAARSREPVEVADPLILVDEPRHKGLPRSERIALAANAADGAWLVLFIHADADGRNGQTARVERVQPGIDRLAGTFGRNRQAVAVIPIRMTESWVLADTDALRQAIGTTRDDRALGLADALVHGADRVRDPKALLRDAFIAARPHAHAAQLSAYLGQIGEAVSFERLRRLEAFRQVESDLEDALLQLAILQ